MPWWLDSVWLRLLQNVLSSGNLGYGESKLSISVERRIFLDQRASYNYSWGFLLTMFSLPPMLSGFRILNSDTLIIRNWLLSRPIFDIFHHLNYVDEYKWQVSEFSRKFETTIFNNTIFWLLTLSSFEDWVKIMSTRGSDQNSNKPFLKINFRKIPWTFLRWRNFHRWVIFMVKKELKNKTLELRFTTVSFWNLSAVKLSIENYSNWK